MRLYEMLRLMGKRVIVSKIYQKHWKDEIKGVTCGNFWSTWKSWTMPRTKTGWVVGFRNLHEVLINRSNGQNFNDKIIEVGETIPCVLVSSDPRSKPMKVPIHHMILEEELNFKDEKIPF